MDIVAVIAGGLRVLLGFLFVLFIPGFVIMLVYSPRLPELKIVDRLVYSTVVSIGSVIVLVLFMDIILGIRTTPGNISIILGGFSALMFVFWVGEAEFLRSTWPATLNEMVSVKYRSLREYFSEVFIWDRFTRTAMTKVVWHERSKSEKNLYHHTYLIDISEEIDICQVDEYKGTADPALVPPPYPRTRYFGLYLRESREDGLSVVEDLRIYPVQVARTAVAHHGFGIQAGSLKIAKRIFTRTDTTDIQWIYGHDFHLFASIYAQDNPGQMVNRVLSKLDAIATAIKRGSPVPSPVDDREAIGQNAEKSFQKDSDSAFAVAELPAPRGSEYLDSGDHKKIQKDILRDLDVEHVSLNTFLKSDKK
jgi:hypothetical protein